MSVAATPPDPDSCAPPGPLPRRAGRRAQHPVPPLQIIQTARVVQPARLVREARASRSGRRPTPTACPSACPTAGPVSASRQSDHLDVTAAPVLAAWRQGDLGADDVRRRLAELLVACDVASIVSRRALVMSGRGHDQRLHADLAEKLRGLLQDKMLPPSTMFDPAKAGSVRGWAYNLATAAAHWYLKSLQRHDDRFRLLEPAEWSGLSNRSHQPSTQVTAGDSPASPMAVEAEFDPDRCADITEAVAKTSRPDRDGVQFRAEALLAGLGLPPVRRLPDLADRERVYRLLSSDPTLAFRSLQQWMSSHRGEEPATAADPMIQRVWSCFTPSQMDRLLACADSLDHRIQIAHLIAVAAVAPMPRPSAKKIRTFVSSAVAASKTPTHLNAGRPSATGLRAVREAAAAFVESECEPVARHATAVIDLPAVLAEHERKKATLEVRLREVAALRTPLGDQRQQVLDSLRRLADRGDPLFTSGISQVLG